MIQTTADAEASAADVGLASLDGIFFRTFLQQHVLGPVPVLAADYGLSGAGWEAAVGGCLQLACVSQEGGSPAAPSSVAAGSSSSEAAKARFAATERMPLQRYTQAA